MKSFEIFLMLGMLVFPVLVFGQDGDRRLPAVNVKKCLNIPEEIGKKIRSEGYVLKSRLTDITGVEDLEACTRAREIVNPVILEDAIRNVPGGALHGDHFANQLANATQVGCSQLSLPVQGGRANLTITASGKDWLEGIFAENPKSRIKIRFVGNRIEGSHTEIPNELPNRQVTVTYSYYFGSDKAAEAPGRSANLTQLLEEQRQYITYDRKCDLVQKINRGGSGGGAHKFPIQSPVGAPTSGDPTVINTRDTI